MNLNRCEQSHTGAKTCLSWSTCEPSSRPNFDSSEGVGRQRNTLIPPEEFSDGAVGLIDGDVCVGAGSGVRVCDGDSAKGLPPDDPGLLPFLPFRIVEAERSERVAMGPTVDGNSLDVACWIKSGAAKHAAQLVAAHASRSKKI